MRIFKKVTGQPSVRWDDCVVAAIAWGWIDGVRSFSAVIVATNGTMARMNTVHPATFVAFKRWLANQPDREALKRRRDVLQADAVQMLLDAYLPQG